MPDYKNMMRDVLGETVSKNKGRLSEDTALKIIMGTGVASLAAGAAIPAMSIKKSSDEHRSFGSGLLHFSGASAVGGLTQMAISGPGTLGALALANKMAKGIK